MIEDVRTLNCEPVIGKSYLVPIVIPCVGCQNGRETPVIGVEHDDAEYLNFHAKHYHLDTRFMTEAEKRRFSKSHAPLYAMAIQVHPGTPVVLKRRKCRERAFPYFYTYGIKNLKDLEAGFADAQLKCRTCPHRGFDLSSVPAIDGIVTCPMHGLRWNATTGKLHRLTTKGPE